MPTTTRTTWVRKSATAKPTFTPADSFTPTMLSVAEQDHHDDAADDVRRRLAERLPEHAQVVRHEERRDRDRDDVREHLAPRREEGPELVEGAAGEAGGAAGLGVHRGGLGVGGGGGGEDQAGDHEHHRRHPGGVDRHEAERVVDRAADVSVGGREQRARPEHALEPAVLGAVLSHQLSNASGPRGCSAGLSGRSQSSTSPACVSGGKTG